MGNEAEKTIKIYNFNNRMCVHNLHSDKYLITIDAVKTNLLVFGWLRNPVIGITGEIDGVEAVNSP